MTDLQQMFTTNPGLSELSLSRREIDDLAELLPILSQFKMLKKLDLSENLMRQLPLNLSCLSRLESLNLNGNQFSNTYHAVDCLSSLPRLLSLNINLSEEEQVDYIMKTLPNLQFLNGLEVERDDEEEEEESDNNEEEEVKHPVTSLNPHDIQEEKESDCEEPVPQTFTKINRSVIIFIC